MASTTALCNDSSTHGHQYSCQVPLSYVLFTHQVLHVYMMNTSNGLWQLTYPVFQNTRSVLSRTPAVFFAYRAHCSHCQWQCTHSTGDKCHFPTEYRTALLQISTKHTSGLFNTIMPCMYHFAQFVIHDSIWLIQSSIIHVCILLHMQKACDKFSCK